jgi:hypothetical protein
VAHGAFHAVVEVGPLFGDPFDFPDGLLEADGVADGLLCLGFGVAVDPHGPADGGEFVDDVGALVEGGELACSSARMRSR